MCLQTRDVAWRRRALAGGPLTGPRRPDQRVTDKGHERDIAAFVQLAMQQAFCPRLGVFRTRRSFMSPES